MKWFLFDQNNSGGGFDVGEKLCHRLFIQAETYEQAEEKALDLGVYFNGCDDDRDCPCCGDRWYRGDELKFPMEWKHYSGNDFVFKNVQRYAQFLADNYGWTKPDGRLFYADGTVKEVFIQSKREGYEN